MRDASFLAADAAADYAYLKGMHLPVLTAGLNQQMEEAVLAARDKQDSVGGVLECMVTGLPAGLGAPFFDSVESVLSHLLFAIPAVKGVEFGEGFGFASMRGSQANDPFRMENGEVTTESNHSGGINGGITNGMPVIFRCAVRPTPPSARNSGRCPCARAKTRTWRFTGGMTHAFCRAPCRWWRQWQQLA